MNKLHIASALIFITVGVFLGYIRGQIALFKGIFNYPAMAIGDKIFWGLYFVSCIIVVLSGIIAGIYIFNKRRYKFIIFSLFIAFVFSIYSLFVVYKFLVEDGLAYLNEFLESMIFSVLLYAALILVIKSKEDFVS